MTKNYVIPNFSRNYLLDTEFSLKLKHTVQKKDHAELYEQSQEQDKAGPYNYSVNCVMNLPGFFYFTS